LKHSKDIEHISKLYADGMTSRQIQALTGISARTVVRHLHKAGVVLRNPGTPHNPKLSDAGLLRRLYVDEGKSTTQIGKEIGATPSNVSRWLRLHGIPTRNTGSEKGHNRTTEETRRKQTEWRRENFIGANNPNWRGGNPYTDPERNRYRAKMWVRTVKDRDGRRCVECGSTDRLHAHHIKRWRDYPDLRYDTDNGVTLCHPCHEKAHGRGFKFRWPQYAKKRTSAPPLLAE
jgi:transposase